jgi:2-polyprenyl-6-methoxyphenol hydroxylase-like FAD-dependent oxidoreductase
MPTISSIPALPSTVPVLIAGGGPVGLAAAVELGRRGIESLVIEPRSTVSHARPRCKTINVRTMEHLRRWGIAARLRERAPLSPEWSKDVVFCTSLTGHELSRFSGVFGLDYDGDRFPELGQQAPQFVLEELLRDVVGELGDGVLRTGLRVVDLVAEADGVSVSVEAADGARIRVQAGYVIGCDGGRSAVRAAIGAQYQGEHALRPNFGMVFRAPELAGLVRHGAAVQYWIVNESAPAVMGPLDLEGTWWIAAMGVDAETGTRTAKEIIAAAAGQAIDCEVCSRDPWTARMQLADRLHSGRVFLAGDAAHLNPPFGGHGLNTGIGDAVDLGWKLAAVIDGWGAPGLLDSYAIERRPLHRRVIDEAVANMSMLSTELLADNLDADTAAGVRARCLAAGRIQDTKRAEFHAVDFVLDEDRNGSPFTIADGGLLPHVWLAPGCSLYDELGPGMTLLRLGHAPDDVASQSIDVACRDRGVPLRIVTVPGADLRERVGADLAFVRPDQRIVWRGDTAPDDVGVLVDTARGAGHPEPGGAR